MPELLDIYDENLVMIGAKDRDAVHRDGDWHRVFHCWIIYRAQDGRDYMVMQRRGPHKDLYPDMLDVTAGGHYAAGETIEGGIREIREELGLDVATSDLIPLGVRVSVMKVGALVDRHFNDVFFLICNRDIRDYAYEPEEVAGLVVFAIDDGLAMFAGERECIPARAVGLPQDDIELCLADFVSSADSYMYRILVVAKQYLNGERHLVI